MQLLHLWIKIINNLTSNYIKTRITLTFWTPLTQPAASLYVLELRGQTQPAKLPASPHYGKIYFLLDGNQNRNS